MFKQTTTYPSLTRKPLRCLLKTIERVRSFLKSPFQEIYNNLKIKELSSASTEARFLTGKIKQENVEQIQYNSIEEKHCKKSRGISTEIIIWSLLTPGSTAFLLLNFLADANVTILTNNGRSIFKSHLRKHLL